MDRSHLSIEQEYALQQFEEGHNLLITGSAGTGKTCLIKQIIASAIERKKVYQVCALTGCAAILLGCNASTIHSWSGIRLGKGTKDEIYEIVKKSKKVVQKWKKTQILIVDEVSMMSKRLFDILNYVGKRVRQNTYKPFGGIQLVFTGDFYQLPPVSGPEEDSGLFCFESDEWYQTFAPDNHLELKTIFRQKDPIYRNILNNIRKGNIQPDNIKLLQTYVNRPYNKEEHNGCVPTKLYAIHRKVESINQSMFDALQEQPYEYNHILKRNCTIYSENGIPISESILQKCNKELTGAKIESELEYLLSNCPCERILRLKKGANVMCTVNLDLESGICNGSIGVIEDFYKSPTYPIPIPVVLFSNGVRRHMSLKYWQSEEYPVLAIAQIPLRLAWAMTIHKIQGATLPMAEIDIGYSIFECGQTYVALSRVQSLQGLYLSGFQPEKIKIHPKVKVFYEKIPDIEYEEEEEEEDKSTIQNKDENENENENANVKKISLSFEQYAYVPDKDENTRTVHL